MTTREAWCGVWCVCCMLCSAQNWQYVRVDLDCLVQLSPHLVKVVFSHFWACASHTHTHKVVSLTLRFHLIVVILYKANLASLGVNVKYFPLFNGHFVLCSVLGKLKWTRSIKCWETWKTVFIFGKVECLSTWRDLLTSCPQLFTLWLAMLPISWGCLREIDMSAIIGRLRYVYRYTIRAC